MVWLRPPTRRQFFGAALAAMASSLAYTRWIEPFWVEYVHRDLPIAGLPSALNGKLLVQFSDLHVGPEVNDDYLREAFKEVAALHPDLVMITGDYMTTVRGEQIDHVARVMEDLPRGKLATVGILGNHDYGHHYHRVHVADQLSARLAKAGVTVLRNEKTTVEGLTIAGIDDLWAPVFRPAQVMPRLDAGRANLVLCHNPDAADLPVWAGYQGWILCGHTHGGQCKPPFLAPPIVPVINKRYIAGEIDLDDGRRLYINRGLGHLKQLRCNARPEVTIFTLRYAAQPVSAVK